MTLKEMVIVRRKTDFGNVRVAADQETKEKQS